MKETTSVIIWLLLVLFLRQNTCDDVFAATSDLENLLLLEMDIVRDLKEMRPQLNGSFSAIDRYLEEYTKAKEYLDSSSMSYETFIGHPVNAFHLIRRMVISYREIKKALLNATAKGNLSRIIEKTKLVTLDDTALPTTTDLSGAANSIAVLQSAYRLNVSEFVRGNIQVIGKELNHVGQPLNARDCLFIGKHAFNKGLYDRAVEWLKACLQVATEEDELTAKRKEIEPFLATAIRVHDEVLQKKGPLGKGWRTNTEPFNKKKYKAKNVKSSPKTREEIEDLIPTNATVLSEQDELEIFHRLCRGEQIRTDMQLKDLHCKLFKPHPYYFLQPIKLEEISKSPIITAMKDFMTDQEISALKTAAKKLQRSQHTSRFGGYQASDKRTSKQAWVTHRNNPIIKRFTDKIGWAVKLNPYPENFGSEYFQVANYGIGGRYIPHTDYGNTSPLMPEKDLPFHSGERIATFMAYLEDVPEGGATAFTLAGVSVWPEKGSAVFWFNLKTSGEGDYRTRHGGCPVLKGSKWICNKWFHERQQLFHRPCSIHKEDIFGIS
ncbi:prolyl 4-hydroxylase subunit alpha-1-like [Artemia franciscana]